MRNRLAAWLLTAALLASLAGCSRPASYASAETAVPVETAPPGDGLCALPLAETASPDKPFFEDVAEGAWYQPYVRTLFELNALPEAERFAPDAPCTRLDFVRYLYGVNNAMGAPAEYWLDETFTDVPRGSDGFEAVMWANGNELTKGVNETTFNPGGTLTREQGATFLCRFAKLRDIPLAAKQEAPQMFKDSLGIQDYARSYVVACRLSGLVSGYNDGTFQPRSEITHAEAAKMVCALWDVSQAGASGGDRVSLETDAYLSYYDEFAAKTFGEPVPESEPVPLSWFDNAAIVGDSVTVALQMYCASTRALGGATFLCAGSLSAINNNLMAVSASSVHPIYKGQKMKIEDGVAACGAKNVYIMLGLNNLYTGVEHTCQDMLTLIDNIKAKSPGVNILIESVTPVAQGGSVLGQGLTNEKINEYNAAIRQVCKEQGWYYLDVASQLKGEDGYLRRDYCGDLPGMGIHFTFAATKIWTDYLISHVPDALK